MKNPWLRLAADGQSSPGVSYPRSVALACSLHTATVLPLCIQVPAWLFRMSVCIYHSSPLYLNRWIIQGRLRHGFHFTLKSIVKETAVTFVTEKVEYIQIAWQKINTKSIEYEFKTHNSMRIYLPLLQRWLAHLCLQTGLLLPKEIGCRWLRWEFVHKEASDYWQMLNRCLTDTWQILKMRICAHRSFTANVQVLLPESFLEEFHSAVFSLEGEPNLKLWFCLYKYICSIGQICFT